MSFTKIDNKESLPNIEEQILKFWQENSIFEKSVENRSPDNNFFFYDGPPFATGLPHYGHLLAGTIKDVIPRYQTMLGRRVERRFGWDTHGLPVEFEAEKELGTKGKFDIEKMGIDKYNEYCRSIVLRYTKEWKFFVARMGRWVDVNNDYKTMDTNFMESIWWVFKTLWDKDLIYKKLVIQAYSARLSTPLSNFEVNLGYREVDDPSITAKFKSVSEENTYFLGWTTTPWTTPSNLALSVHPELDYVLVDNGEGRYYIGEQALPNYAAELGEYKIIKKLKGVEMEKMRYEPLFPYFAEYAETGSFIIALADYVTAETGTGLVHTAPMFGEDDFRTGQKYALPVVLPMNESGEFIDPVSEFKGMFFKDADKHIIKALKEKGLLFHHNTIRHKYPFCWRSDTPLMYRAIPSWFVNVEKIKDMMVANNKSIHYSPEHIRDGRMGKWLEGARDWCISRNRYWGTPLPVWVCDSCDHVKCIGSRAELEELSGRKLDDLHRHFIDDIELSCEKCGNPTRRTTEVLDCWFESGSMPYAQEHYPFENKEKFERSFPANFISEGIDQTRGWFYTLSVLSTALFEKPAYRNIIVSGLILASDGQKMSKRLKNYPDPILMFNKHGADSIRLYMLSSGAVKGEELKFTEEGLIEVNRNILIPFRNALSFFTLYANIDNWSPDNNATSVSSNSLDVWIVSQLNELIRDIRKSMSQYDLLKSVQPLVGFIDQLTNWYIRRSRRRFWKSGNSADKYQAYATLYYILKTFSQVIAPFIPFTAESIFQTLKNEVDPESVHLTDYPEADQNLMDVALNHNMQIVIDAVSMGRFIRASQQIKNRQPLTSIMLVTSDENTRKVIEEMSEQIKEELNVKEVIINEDEKKLITFSARPNLPKLGPKYGKKMKDVTVVIKDLSDQQISQVVAGETLKVQVNDEEIGISAEDLIIDRNQKADTLIQTKGNLIVGLDIHLTDELIEEGLAREVVNKIQNRRKEMNLEITDYIKIQYSAPQELSSAINAYVDYIKRETLCDELIESSEKDQANKYDINEYECGLSISII